MFVQNFSLKHLGYSKVKKKEQRHFVVVLVLLRRSRMTDPSFGVALFRINIVVQVHALGRGSCWQNIFSSVFVVHRSNSLLRAIGEYVLHVKY